MNKPNQEGVLASGAGPALAPANYKLVGLEKDFKEKYIPLLSRTYTAEELKRADILELLHRLGWEHVEKN